MLIDLVYIKKTLKNPIKYIFSTIIPLNINIMLFYCY